MLAVIEETVRNLLPNYVVWAWMLALAYAAYELIHSKRLKKKAIIIRKKLSKRENVLAYILLTVCGAALFGAFWYGVNKAHARYIRMSSPRESHDTTAGAESPEVRKPSPSMPITQSPPQHRKSVHHPAHPNTPEHRTVAFDGSTVKTTERLDGGLDFDIQINLRNGLSENQVTIAFHEYFGGVELLPVFSPRENDMMPNEQLNFRLTPKLSRQTTIEFQVGVPLVVIMTVDYDDAGTRMQYLFEGHATYKVDYLDIVKTERNKIVKRGS